MRLEEKKSGCAIFFIIILVVLIAIVAFFMYSFSKNPVEFEEKLDDVTNQLLSYIQDTTGVDVGAEKKPEDNIQFPEKEKLTEAQKYYYYQQLSNTAQKIYLTIENNIEALKNGDDNIPLPPSLNEIAKSSENGKKTIEVEFQNAWDAFVIDRSEYFYLDSSKVCLVTKTTTRGSNTNYEFFIGKGENKTYFIDEFTSKEQVDSAVTRVEQVKNDVLKNATGSNYEKMKYIHDWIVDNVKYDTANSENTANIYGCLVNKNVVCEGYARAFKYFMDELDIPCILVSGNATDEYGKSERHAWNYVYIKNNWYAIDTTWDDPIIIGNGKVDSNIKYKYFLRGSKTMNKDHSTSGQITKNGFDFSYPELSEEDIQ